MTNNDVANKVNERNQLIQQATRAAKFRGHDMGDWLNCGLNRAISNCRACGMQAVINTNPMPNDIDIGGRAVALNCTKEWRPNARNTNPVRTRPL